MEGDIKLCSCWWAGAGGLAIQTGYSVQLTLGALATYGFGSFLVTGGRRLVVEE